MSTASKVAADKAKHPGHFCPAPGCLWKTAKLNPITGERGPGGFCPRHVRHAPGEGCVR